MAFRFLYDAAFNQVSLFFKSLPLHCSVSSRLTNRLMSSSHLILGLPTLLFVRVVALSLGFNLVAFFVHLSSACDAILTVNFYFGFLCVSIQHGILAARSLSSASLVLLLMYSIHPSSSISSVCPSLRRGRSRRIRCCFDRILYSCCFLRLSLLSYSAGFSRRLLILFLRFSCVFAVFERRAGASCVASIESFSRARASVSKCQNRTSAWE